MRETDESKIAYNEEKKEIEYKILGAQAGQSEQLYAHAYALVGQDSQLRTGSKRSVTQLRMEKEKSGMLKTTTQTTKPNMSCTMGVKLQTHKSTLKEMPIDNLQKMK